MELVNARYSIDGTSTELVKDLEKEKENPKISRIIDNAKKLYYDDYSSPLATPKINLVLDLKDAGLESIAKKVIEGDYD